MASSRPTPAREMRTQGLHRGEGKTPELSVDEMQTLLQSFRTDTVVGLWDRALTGMMTYRSAREDAVLIRTGRSDPWAPSASRRTNL